MTLTLQTSINVLFILRYICDTLYICVLLLCVSFVNTLYHKDQVSVPFIYEYIKSLTPRYSSCYFINLWKGKVLRKHSLHEENSSLSFIEWKMPLNWRPLVHEQNSIFKCKQHTIHDILKCKQHKIHEPEKYKYTVMLL